MLLKIESSKRENEKLRQKLAEDKVEARASGLDTLAKAVNRAREENVSGSVCTTYAKELVVAGYRVCAVDTTQIDSWEADAQEPIEDVVDTQEQIAEMEHPTESNLEVDTQEPLDDTVVTQEPTVEAEANQREKEEAETQ